jgi:predicted Zn-dependent protease
MALEREAAAKGHPVEVLRELGRLHAEMAKSGLLESARTDAARQKALDYYGRALSKSPQDAQLSSACGELLLVMGDLGQATERLTGALSQSKGSAAVAALLAEALLRQGRFKELRAFARAGRGRFTGSESERERLDQALALWARGSAA